MFENELQDLRRHKWRVDTPTRAIFTVDDAREFLHGVGFCLEYPLRHPVLAPTFIGAVMGSDQNLPVAKAAFLHPRAKEAVEFKDRLLRERSAFEAGFGEDDNLLISAVEFPFFYALIGDRNPKTPPSPGERGERQMLKSTWELIQEHGPILETALRERLGEFVSDVALSRTLSELRQKLRIVRIDDEGGAMWDLLLRWSPQVVNQGKQISAQEALSALVSKYLETCVAADQKDVEEFFGHIVPRSRVTEVIKALLGAREFGFIQVNGKTLLRNTPRVTAEEKAAQIAASAAPKPAGRANRSFKARPAGEAPRKNVWEKYGPRKDKVNKFGKPGGFGKKFDRGERKPWPKDGDANAAAGAAPRSEWKSDAPRDWKKSGPKKPWQKPAEGGEGASFGGSRPPKKFGAKRFGDKKFGARPDWKKGDDAPTSGPRPEWKKKSSGPRDFKKSGPGKPWQKRVEGGEGAPRRELKKEGETRPAFTGPRPEWKKKPGGPRDWKKPGPKKPWQSESKEGGSDRPPKAERPFKKAGPGGFKRSGTGGFKRSGPGGGGFKKPFKKAFKKSSRPGGFGPKPPRRPA